jgi:IclR family transcriptional regulator, KDG regulon repressor
MLLTVKKIGPILDLFSVEHPEWGVTEVAHRLRIAKSSAHAMLTSLVNVGLLTATSQNRYRLGWRFLDLGETLKASLDLHSAALPVMRELVRAHRETTQLAVFDRGRALYVQRVQGTLPVRFCGVPIGSRWPLHACATGKVLLSARSRGEAERVARAEGLSAFTSNTITDLDRLQEELEGVRRRGQAIDRREYLPDVCCVAAPVLLEQGFTVAALSIAVPASRFQSKSDGLRRIVDHAANRISRDVQRLADRQLPDPKAAPLATPMGEPRGAEHAIV